MRSATVSHGYCSLRTTSAARGATVCSASSRAASCSWRCSLVRVHIKGVSAVGASAGQISSAADARGSSIALFPRWTEHTDDRIKQSAQRLFVQDADFRHEQLLIGREQLSGPRVTDDAERALREVGIRELSSLRVRIWTAGDLTQDPISATGSLL